MSASDGHVIGPPTKLLDNGPDEARLVVVLVAEGFLESEQAAFNTACQTIVQSMQQEPFFGAVSRVFNVYRVNVASDEAGIDSPTECGGTGATPRTYFDASLCGGGGVARLVDIDEELVLDTVNSLIPDASWIGVIANTTEDAGSAGTVAVVGLSSIDAMLHELGHLFGLADEYDFLISCAGDDDRDHAPAEEPAEPNVTAIVTREDLPWAYLVRPETLIPTMLNPDCSRCDERPNEIADDFEPGLFEGANTYHCGYFRGSYACKMRNNTSPFCRVCVDALHDAFSPLLQAVLTSALTADLTTIAFGSVPVDTSTSRSFRLINIGADDVVGIEVVSDDPNLTAILEGGIDSLEPGGSVRVDLILQPIAVTGDRTPRITVTSSAPILTLEATVHVCQPQPLVSFGGPLDFGAVAAGLTVYGSLTVYNTGGVCSAPATILPQEPTGPFRLAPGTPSSFVLPALGLGEEAERRIFIEYTAPTGEPFLAVGEVSIQIAEQEGVTYLADLFALAVDPEPVSAVLVIDRSGSMAQPTAEGGQTKIDHAIAAADLFLTLLRDFDSVGIVRFNNHASEEQGDLLLPMTPVEAGRESARAVLTVENLLPSGNTSIGAGMILGSGVLDAASADARALVVLTDGRQNRDPDIPTAREEILIQTPPQRVFAVGLGLNQLEETLHEVSDATNGIAQITGPLEGDGEFLLQKLYVQILSDLNREAFIEDPVLNVPPRGERRVSVGVSAADLSLDVVIAFRRGRAFPASLGVALVAPNGVRIDLAEILAGGVPNVSATVRSTHVVIRVLFPAFPGQPDAHVGSWKVEVQNRAAGRTRLHCSVMAKGRSNLLLTGSLVQAGFGPGAGFTIVLEPTRYGQPALASGRVTARVRRPDGVVRTVECQRTEHGSYIGRYDDTHKPGHYRVETTLAFEEPGRRHRVTRYRHLTGIVVAPRRRPPRDRPRRGR